MENNALTRIKKLFSEVAQIQNRSPEEDKLLLECCDEFVELSKRNDAFNYADIETVDYLIRGNFAVANIYSESNIYYRKAVDCFKEVVRVFKNVDYDSFESDFLFEEMHWQYYIKSLLLLVNELSKKSDTIPEARLCAWDLLVEHRLITAKIAAGQLPKEYSDSNACILLAERCLAYGDYDGAIALYDAVLDVIRSQDTYAVSVYQRIDTRRREIVESKRALNKEERERIDKELDKYLSADVLALMDDAPKSFLYTSLTVFNMIGKNDTIDYSCVSMPLLKSLDYTLHVIFGEAFLDYLKKNCIPSNPKGISRNYFVNKNTTTNREFIDRITYMSIADIIWQVWFVNGNVERINFRFEEFLTHYGVLNPDVFAKWFAEQLEDLRLLRNNTAHRNEVTIQDYEKANAIMLKGIKFLEKTYTALSPVFLKYKS